MQESPHMQPTTPHPMPNDPEVVAFIELSNSFYPADAFLGTIEQSRAWYNRYAAHMRKPFPPEVATEDFFIAGRDAGQQLAGRRYRHQTRTASDTTVLYIHGGGFVLGGLESHADVCAGLCQLTGLDVVACTYRLAPEHVHPAQMNDVEAAYMALLAQGQCVLLCGDSAGGNLAAGLCVRLNAKGVTPALGQVLIYPGLGGDTTQGSYLSRAHAPMLTTDECTYYFSIRAEGLTDAERQHPELRPLLATDFSATPQTLVITADIDPLRDDGVHYVERLRAAGVAAVYRNEPELVHGCLRARHMSARTAAFFLRIAQGLQDMASGQFKG